MKWSLLLLLALASWLHPGEASAEACSAQKKARALEPATRSRSTFHLDCDLVLRKGEVISKMVRITGAKSSGVRLVCQGGAVGLPARKSLFRGKDIIEIRSARSDGGGWSRPENVLIEGCEVNGAIRIMGLGPNGQAKNVKASSRRKDHTQRAQAAAPRGIVLRNLVVRGDGRIPVYFAPGVTNSKLLDSRIVGQSVSSGVYLDAESAENEISGNVFAVKTPRELLSIDGSAKNLVTRNMFNNSNQGGVYVYRNCGEGGAARHQKPRFNRISDNTFRYSGSSKARPTIWLSFSSTLRSVVLCPQDRGIRFGSGADDRNFARKNTVANNTFIGSPISEVIRDNDRDNRLADNRLVRK